MCTVCMSSVTPAAVFNDLCSLIISVSDTVPPETIHVGPWSVVPGMFPSRQSLLKLSRLLLVQITILIKLIACSPPRILSNSLIK
jgi:hypothetical protein